LQLKSAKQGFAYGYTKDDLLFVIPVLLKPFKN